LTSGDSDSDAARHLRALDVDLAHQMLGAVIGLTDLVGGEGVGLGDIRAGLEIGAVDGLGHLRLGQREDVVVALLVMAQAERAGIIRLGQLPVLDLGAERAIGDQDALGGLGKECVACGHATSDLNLSPPPQGGGGPLGASRVVVGEDTICFQ
jgi:hypothetical protein